MRENRDRSCRLTSRIATVDAFHPSGARAGNTARAIEL
jgi:hypothetical protein